jgi:hypothetical protein
MYLLAILYSDKVPEIFRYYECPILHPSVILYSGKVLEIFHSGKYRKFSGTLMPNAIIYLLAILYSGKVPGILPQLMTTVAE